MTRTFQYPCAFESITDLKDAVREARSAAEREARKHCGKGWLMSRGAWVIGLAYNEGDPVWSDGMIEFAGTYKQMDELLHDAVTSMPQRIDCIRIEGGYNFAETMADVAAGTYDPWVSEWSVVVWERKEHAA